MVFDTDSGTFCFYDGISWQFITTVAYVDSIKQEIKLEIYAELGVNDIEGNHYAAVKIGNQVWMGENLLNFLHLKLLHLIKAIAGNRLTKRFDTSFNLVFRYK
jgi:hypothetical protein